MTILTRYILRQLVVALLVVTLGLLGLLWLSQSLRFIELIVDKGLDVMAFLELTALLLPGFLVVILPIALFAVSLFTYNRLLGDRELLVAQGAGMGPLRLARPALLLATLVAVLCLGLNLWLVPASASAFKEMQWTVRHGLADLVLREGAFTEVTDGVTVFVGNRAADGTLEDLVLHDARDAANRRTIMARRGALRRAADGQGVQVLLSGGSRQQADAETGRFSILYFDEYTMRLGAAPPDPGTRYRDARERTVGELFALERDDVLAKDYGAFMVEAHQRLASPLHALGFTLVGLACLLGADFNRRGQGGRVMLAIALVVALQAASLGVTNLAARNLDTVFLIYAVALLPVLAAFWQLADRPRPDRLFPSKERTPA